MIDVDVVGVRLVVVLSPDGPDVVVVSVGSGMSMSLVDGVGIE